jgi:hypothetical protein
MLNAFVHIPMLDCSVLLNYITGLTPLLGGRRQEVKKWGKNFMCSGSELKVKKGIT